MDDVARLLRQETTCPRCGQIVRWSGRGRPPKWCSDSCRVEAYRERKAAANGAVGIEVREVVKVVEPSWDELIERVIASPKATARVLRAARKIAAEAGYGDRQWAPVAEAVRQLGDDSRQRQQAHTGWKPTY